MDNETKVQQMKGLIKNLLNQNEEIEEDFFVQEFEKIGLTLKNWTSGEERDVESDQVYIDITFVLTYNDNSFEEYLVSINLQGQAKMVGTNWVDTTNIEVFDIYINVLN